MHWLSQGVEQLIAASKYPVSPFSPEVMVVGSGYGGAVAALRFAEKGLSVAVLERGAEYGAGEFPTDLGQFGGFVRAEVGGAKSAKALGYEEALFDFRVGTRASALVGNGLGGGSLINAAVALRPDARVFAQPAWPGQVRDDNLDADFARAVEVLEVQSPQTQRESAACVPQQTLKYARLQDIGKAAHARFASARLSVTTEDVPLAIEFRKQPAEGLGPREACIGCGDCCTGCNHNAKLSLDKTYLARARKAGARLFTGVSVLWVEHQPNAAQPGRDWIVHCVRTTERGNWGQVQDAGRKDLAQAYAFSVRAGRVVLSAGTFGSSEILLRSQLMGLDVASLWLGKGISANGDDLSAAYDLKNEANAVGEGSGPERAHKVGPTISGVIRFHDHQDHTCSTVTEDGGIPGMLKILVNEGMTTLGILPQIARFGLRAKTGQDPLAVRTDAIQHSLALLGMGHDSSAGYAQLASPGARLNWAWAAGAVDPAPLLHRARASSVEGAGAEFLPNPATGVLPDRVGAVLSGPKTDNGWITVHPLGGCRMASSPQEGVVNHRGQVFKRSGDVHAGLVVMDGSVVPTSLGVNPLLTITALAERACRLALGEIGKAVEVSTPLPQHPAKKESWKSVNGALRGATMAEVLRGPLSLENSSDIPQWIQPGGKGGVKNAALFLEMDVVDWQQLWQDPTHTLQAISGSNASRSLTASRLVIDHADGTSTVLKVTGGTVQMFRPADEFVGRRWIRTLRSGLTYWISRWHPDGARPNAPKGSWRVKWDGLKLLWNSSAARTFDYRLELSDGPSRYWLSGQKFIQPAMSWSELGSWVKAKWQGGGWPAPQRRSVWDQITQLDVQLHFGSGGQLLAQGRLAMDIPEMTRRIAPQLKAGPDVVNAIGAFISYPLMVLRYIISSRMLDFRLPDYASGLAPSDPAALPDNGHFELPHDKFPPIRLPSGVVVYPEAPVCLTVPLKAGTHPSEDGAESIRIGLVHYAQPTVGSSVSKEGMRRHKSIILLNGFAQNTLPFVAEELGDRALAAMLYAHGWDVWLLEYRVSPFLHASARFSSMDDIGACDLPAAVSHVLGHLQSQQAAPDAHPGQLFVLSHCVGSASTAMSMLGGHLQYPDGTPKVAGVLFSQFQPYVIGSATAQMRLQVASLMVNALGLDFVEFAAGTAEADGLHAAIDRFFASFHYEAEERCPGEHDLRHSSPDSTSCKRMSGLLSRLFQHDQLIPSRPGQPGTHEKLDQYFGRTNLGVFLHGAKCAEYEHLVDADGQNIYVTDENVRKYLTMPVMLMHGEDNVLFDKESLHETQRQFSRAFGAERLRTGHDRFLVAEGHAHFDCTIGRRAPEVIFKDIVDFYDNALTAAMPEPSDHNRLRARLPRTGPICGWTRREDDAQVLRVWIEVDNAQPDTSVAAMTVVSAGPYRCVQAWGLYSEPLKGLVGVSAQAEPDQSITYAVADVRVPLAWKGPITVAMVSLHRYSADAPDASSSDDGMAWPQSWGAPMTLGEAGQNQGRSPPVSTAQSGAHAVPHHGRAKQGTSPNAQWVPADAIAPLPMELAMSDASALLRPLASLVKQQRAVALSAHPGTLSRQRRALRWMRDCVLRVHSRQLVGEQATEVAFRFIASTCRHPGVTELEAHRSDVTLLALAQRERQAPSALMWMLGDQIYADARGGLADTTSPIETLLPRYREAFGSEGFKQLSRSLPLHMVMDDHEIADNWSCDEPKLGKPQSVLAFNAVSAFNAFQRPHGPKALGLIGENYAFRKGGAAFLNLNTRIHRDRALGPHQQRRLLSDDQWRLLEDWLLAEQAMGKHPKFLVTGSVFAPGVVQGLGSPSVRDSDNWQLDPEGRKRLLSFIAAHHIDNVVFLSGDYHCSARATVVFSHSDVRAYCLVTPPLHAPMVFANVAAEDVLQHERLHLAEGTADIDAKAWNGEGWLECELSKSGSGFSLDLTFRVQTYDARVAETFSESWYLG